MMDTPNQFITALYRLGLLLSIVTPCLMAYFILVMGKRTAAFATAMRLEREGFVRALALVENIPVVEGETLTELFERIIRIRVWREKGIGGLPPTKGGSDEDQVHRGL